MDNIFVVDENGNLAQNTVVASLDSCIETDASGKKALRIVANNNGGTSDYNDLKNKPAIDGVVLNANTKKTDLNISDDYSDLKNKPAIEGVELTPTTTLADLGITNSVSAMVHDYGLYESVTLMSITNPAQPGEGNRITIEMPEALKAEWKIAGLVKWEIKDEYDGRVDAIPVNMFTMNSQTSIRIFFKTTGPSNRVVNRGTIGVLLVRR